VPVQPGITTNSTDIAANMYTTNRDFFIFSWFSLKVDQIFSI
jgi:hypothetical protein